LMLPLVNTEAMNLHLAEIARRYPDEPIALVLDGAGWHKGENLVVPDNMIPIPLIKGVCFSSPCPCILRVLFIRE
jgi:hypothetical protein